MLLDFAREEIFDQLKSALNALSGAEVGQDLVLEYPPDLKMGDFAFPTFRFAKALKKAPPVIAKEVLQTISQNPEFTKKYSVSIAGSYINFSLKHEILLSDVLSSLLLSGDHLAERVISGQQPTIVLEFSSPNVAKPFNIYHLRSTMIGNCLSRIFKARGYHTVCINHLGDWGTQFGTLAVAYEMWGDDKELEKSGIPYLVDLYVRINKSIESDEALAQKAREYFARLEKGDPAITALWKKFVQLSLKEYQNTYQRLGVRFDHYWGESFYSDKIHLAEDRLKSCGLLQESQGATIVNLEAFNMPPCIIRKQDGSTLYATRDLAAAIYRHEQFRFEKMIYVVGGEQKLHFAQIFKVLELMGYAWAKDCIHIDFGLYRFGDAQSGFQKMSTRKGKFITMETVLDQAVEQVQGIMEEKAKQQLDSAPAKMSTQERSEAAEIIGVGAIVFNDLSTDRNHDVNFDLDRVLDFEGETGPYIQYAHTRCLSILRNAPAPLLNGIDPNLLLDLSKPQHGFQKLLESAKTKLSQDEELDLIRTLAKLPIVLDSVLDQFRPSSLAGFLIDVTKAFNAFYRAHKVLVEDTDLAQARLALVLATQRTLLKGLDLLGMRVPHRM